MIPRRAICVLFASLSTEREQHRAAEVCWGRFLCDSFRSEYLLQFQTYIFCLSVTGGSCCISYSCRKLRGTKDTVTSEESIRSYLQQREPAVYEEIGTAVWLERGAAFLNWEHVSVLENRMLRWWGTHRIRRGLNHFLDQLIKPMNEPSAVYLFVEFTSLLSRTL